MRSLAVIDMAPAIESSLRVVEACERCEREHFGRKAAVEALIFATSLRMIRLAVNGLDAELQQPEA